MPWPWESKAAVDERFYVQNPTAFTVARADNWRGDGFNITNSEGGAAVLQVQTDHVGNGNLRSLVVLDAAASHDPLLALEEFRSGDGHKWWEAFRGRGTSGKDRLFAAVDKTQFLQMGNTVHIFLDGDSSGDRAPDLVVSGSYSRGTMTVARGGDDADFVAQIRKETAYTV